MRKKRSIHVRAERVSKKVQPYSHKRNQKDHSGRDGPSVMGRFPIEIDGELPCPREQDARRYAVLSKRGEQACLASKKELRKGVSS